MIAIGAMVAGYRIEGIIGAGGMGTVYLAQNPELPRRDALKVLSAELSCNEEFRARFIREADVAAGLQHPNIVSIYSRGETEDGQLWIAMQFVNGTDADEALRVGTMSPVRAMHILGEVAQALDYAHDHKVVHRDVKPANFLLSSDAPEHVLLGDFGIARGLDDVGLTMTGSIIATMAYAAPEVLAGLPFDGRADLYSLGCSLFRLLTGKTPFARAGANGPAAVMMAHLHQPPPRVTDLVPGLPAALDAVIAAALAKNPAERFQSAGEFGWAATAALYHQAASDALLQALPGAEVSSYPGPEIRPHTGLPRYGALAAVVLLVVATITALMLTRENGHQKAVASATTTAPATTSTAPPPTPTVAVSALRGLLLPLDQVKQLIGGMNPQIFDISATWDLSDPVVEKECAGAWEAGQEKAYATYVYKGVELQELIDQADPLKLNMVIQSVVGFPSAEQARGAVDDQVHQWDQCANRTITLQYPGKVPAHVTFGAPATDSNGIHIISHQQELAPQQHCEHALTSRNNVVVDVNACSTKPGNQAVEIAGQIAGRISHA
ncbi:serine/threonine-protein kinase PknH/PknJ [Mycobacterium sp.]|uniref:serine/threonine-protein kinase PknH/PknJ n=1 Tax=Mycobacterium sp. TaxID=1785 RepID=UPI003D6B9F3E